MPLNQELLNILVCPTCRQTLRPVDDEQGLACEHCAKVYPVEDNIPVLLAEEAVSALDWQHGKRRVAATR